MDIRYHMLIDALDGTPRDLRRLLRPVTPQQTTHAGADGRRLLDVLCQFAGTESRARSQFELVLSQDKPKSPTLESFAGDYESASEAIDAFAAERTLTTALLAGITQPHWLRTATLTNFGPLRLRALVERLIARDNAQLALIVDMRESLSQ
jgi:hypothetical protein